MEQDIPKFSSKDEEIQYWKNLANQYQQGMDDAREDTRLVERELEEFQENSQQLEKELETQLDQADQTIRELKTRSNRLQLDNDTLKDNIEQIKRQNNTQIAELQSTISDYREHEEQLLKYIRELEQKNDDLERSHRAMMTTVSEFEARLNSATERNALLETEQDEWRGMVQRLKDEARDLRQEMKIRKRELPDNDKSLERVRSPIDSNKLKVEMETQTGGSDSPTKMTHGGSNIPLTPPARISAMNIVGDLLRKVGALESKLATCRNTSRESVQSAGEVTVNKEAFRGRRLNRGTSSPSIQGVLRA